MTVSSARQLAVAWLAWRSHASRPNTSTLFFNNSTTNENTRINSFRPIKFESVFFEKQRARLSAKLYLQLSHFFRNSVKSNNFDLNQFQLKMSGIPGPRSGISRPTKLPAPSTLPRAAPMKRTRDGDDVGVYKFEGAAGQPTKKAKPTTMAPPTLTSRTSTTAATRKPPTTASTLTTRRPLATKNANPVNSRSKLTMNSTIASSAPATEKPKGKIFYMIFSSKHYFNCFYFQANQRELHGI